MGTVTFGHSGEKKVNNAKYFSDTLMLREHGHEVLPVNPAAPPYDLLRQNRVLNLFSSMN